MDPGHDDALALLTALVVTKVTGVTTVAGNQTLEKTTLNARRVLAAADRDIPVAPGYSTPLFCPLVTAGHIHGESGLDGYDFPDLPGPENVVGAMPLLESVFDRATEPVHWVATGPLTNVAAFLLGHPHLREKVASLSIMGGALSGGNITANAEFNFYVDPDAAAYVLQSGVPIRLVGLDVTHKALLRFSQIPRFKTLASPIGDMLFGLISFFSKREAAPGADGIPIHDVLAVAALLEPHLFRWDSVPLSVGRFGERRGAVSPVQHGPLVDVAIDIEVEAFFDWMWQCLAAYQD